MQGHCNMCKFVTSWAILIWHPYKEVKSQKSSSCHKCVLLMDHHCPWIHNCVGLFNRRYFFNFCFFTTIGLYFVAISLLPYYISLKQHYNPSSFPWLWFPKSSIAENMNEHLERRTDLVFAFCCLVILPLRKRIQIQYQNWNIKLWNFEVLTVKNHNLIFEQLSQSQHNTI